MSGSRLVIGPGGSGRTHRLRALAEFAGGRTGWLAGSPLAPVTSDEVAAAVESEPDLVVADDLQWFEPDALAALIETAKRLPIYASRRPSTGAEPDPDRLELLGELLTREQPAERLGPLDVDRFSAALAALRNAAATRPAERDGRALASDEVERLLSATGGSVGLVADAVAAGWDGDMIDVPAALVDAVGTRLRRSGRDAARLAALWAAVDPPGEPASLAAALAALPPGADRDRAERSARAGGLLTDDGSLIPLVAHCSLAALTTAQQAELHDRLAEALLPTDPRAAARHLLVGNGEVGDAAGIVARAALTLAVTDPHEAERYTERAEQLGLGDADAALLRALAAFHAGSPEALGFLDDAHRASGGTDDRAAVLGYGIDLRDLRFDDAAERPVTGELAGPLRAVAAGLAGRREAIDTKVTSPLARVVSGMATGLTQLAEGSVTDAMGSFSTAADDFDRLKPTTPFGITPHSLGALAALSIGDATAVEMLTEQAIIELSGGVGEALTHRVIQAYGRLVSGDYSEALALLRRHCGLDDAGQPAGPTDATSGTPAPIDDLDDLADATDIATGGGPPRDATAPPTTALDQRDRLLLASLEAAIARRSGDTTRLRAAWKRSEEALIRPSASWLLIDPFTELLAAGARLGDTRRVTPVVDRLTAQGLDLPDSGPGPVGAHWLRLQVAIAAEDSDTVAEVAALMSGCEPSDARSRVRVAAAAIWAKIMTAEAGEAEVVEVAERLSDVGDRWEASRILGQAALDEADPKAARRLLELARVSTSEHVDSSTSEGLGALGLSEREAEVALLVVEGRTHKEVGAQLFISPKTVEHHVAKIRQKVGASSRAELLSIIREAIGNR